MRRLLLLLPLVFAGCGPELVKDVQPPPKEDCATCKSGQDNDSLFCQADVFLAKCLEKYDREVKGYSVTFCKRERIKGKLPEELEEIDVQFREHPFSVFFDWKKGAGKAQRILYVEGENKGMMRVRPTGWKGIVVVSRDPDGEEAMEKSFYSIKQFGVKLATQRSLASMVKAKANGKLHVKYEGTFKVAKLHDRECHKFVRTPFDPPEEEGLMELTLYIDAENWLQVGSILKDGKGELISEYYFRDLKINPEFRKGQFTGEGL